MDFRTGDRVRFSQEWLDVLSMYRCERALPRRGTVVGDPQHPKAQYVRVKWDDAKAEWGVNYAPKFIEKVPRSPAAGQASP